MHLQSDSIPTQMLMDTGESLPDHEVEGVWLLFARKHEPYVVFTWTTADEESRESLDVLLPASSLIQEVHPTKLEEESPPPTTPPLASPNSFKALSSASSPSPDPASMALSASPSTAEIVANVINRTNGRVTSSYRSSFTDSTQSPKARHGFRMHTGAGPPSPGKQRLPKLSMENGESSSQIISDSQNAQNPQVVPDMPSAVDPHPTAPNNGRRASEHIGNQSVESSQAIPCSQTMPDSQPIVISQNPTAIPEQKHDPVDNTHTAPVTIDTIDPSVLHSHSLPYSLSPGHNISVLESRPSSVPLTWSEPISPHSYHLAQREGTNRNILKKTIKSAFKEPRDELRFIPFQLNVQSDDKSPISSQQESSELQVPHGTVPRFAHEVNQLHSSLDPSIVSDMSDIDHSLGSQWPMQTQAPYNFDSQVTVDSQSQNILL